MKTEKTEIRFDAVDTGGGTYGKRFIPFMTDIKIMLAVASESRIESIELEFKPEELTIGEKRYRLDERKDQLPRLWQSSASHTFDYPEKMWSYISTFNNKGGAERFIELFAKGKVTLTGSEEGIKGFKALIQSAVEIVRMNDLQLPPTATEEPSGFCLAR